MLTYIRLLKRKFQSIEESLARSKAFLFQLKLFTDGLWGKLGKSADREQNPKKIQYEHTVQSGRYPIESMIVLTEESVDTRW